MYTHIHTYIQQANFLSHKRIFSNLSIFFFSISEPALGQHSTLATGSFYSAKVYPMIHSRVGGPSPQWILCMVGRIVMRHRNQQSQPSSPLWP